jgi:hypothetical protein
LNLASKECKKRLKIEESTIRGWQTQSEFPFETRSLVLVDVVRVDDAFVETQGCTTIYATIKGLSIFLR